MSSLFFTSDLHFGDPRLNIFSRDLFFSSMDQMHEVIINNFNSKLKPNDTLVIVGDVCYDSSYIDLIDQINCDDKILIIGNYDEDKLDILKRKFGHVFTERYFQIEYGENDNFGILVAHKPVDVIKAKFKPEMSKTLD